ncbi:MAG: nucleotidyltransferase domain-containing protein [Dehalococcoidia bacterium]|nr:nucleotidyltransferase domain-containing protein [Dehalococcoidia bacterium]
MPSTGPDDNAFRSLLARCTSALTADRRVLGLCLFGSLASNTHDCASDIDLGILVDEGQLAGMLEDGRWMRDVAPILVHGTIGSDTACLCALHRWMQYIIKVDYTLFHPAALPPWYHTDVCILYDPTATFLTLSRSSPHAPCPPSLNPDDFWIGFSSALRMLRRGECLEALDILTSLRDPTVTYLLSDVYRIPFRNYRHAEATYPAVVLLALHDTYASPTRDDILRALVQLGTLYCDVRSLVSQHEGSRHRQIMITLCLESGLLHREEVTIATHTHELPEPPI